MCTRIRERADGILDAADGRLLAAKAKWSRLTPGALSGIANKQDLITGVEEHYNLSHAAAVQDVELWDARVRGAYETAPRFPARNEVSP
jgi:hypothetical protein